MLQRSLQTAGTKSRVLTFLLVLFTPRLVDVHVSPVGGFLWGTHMVENIVVSTFCDFVRTCSLSLSISV